MKWKIGKGILALLLVMVLVAVPLTAAAKKGESVSGTRSQGGPWRQLTQDVEAEAENGNGDEGEEANRGKEAGQRELMRQRWEEKKQLQVLSREEKEVLRHRNLADRIYVRGMNLKFDVPPVIKDGGTLVPVRAITEGLGAAVVWDPENRTVTIERDGTEIVLHLVDGSVTVDGIEYILDVPAQLISNRTFVPLRFISEILGARVEYDEETGDIDILDPDGNDDEEDTDENGGESGEEDEDGVENA